MKTKVKQLRLFSKLSLVFGLIVILTKIFTDQNIQLWIKNPSGQGLIVPPGYYVAIIVNLLFNAFIFLAVSLVFASLAQILEKLSEQDKSN